MDAMEGGLEEEGGETEKELRFDVDPYYKKPSKYLKM